ncbi:type II toxin-antitoxin system HipA family toxin [Shewanella sp. NIFS-20-20]|uniref:type II toxin-antitoxin system HipA family toxin n=1 Tax=Shewanella sp. NIFS-20-20 TaxID=2853806 RepID=UPI001C490F31|nr:type II toxin-antitoxin system HipA family toxin [Shewanella sp. NIFS-20-20]MBV7317257.1 type II toxin-antitoxin system HipA family toxin [Shewanella sp. NIFS-20-20]
MAVLDIYMNGYLVGEFTKSTTGSHLFEYAPQWLEIQGSRPISLSMPLRKQVYKGDEVYNFFDNLLPDNIEVRNRIVARHNAQSTQAFDLLSKVGQDSVGALQLVPHGQAPFEVKKIEAKPLSDEALEKVLKGYQSDIPLGMLNDEDDFRISIAGAQEKTALLNLDGQWKLPIKATPTTHIIKLPIGDIQSHSYRIDMSDSVENEYLCMMIVREFGLAVPHCSIIKVGDIKALAVDRFDRKLSSDGQWIMRLPQEDFCQTLNVPPAKKYESHGGPGIEQIMPYLVGSTNADQDRLDFMKSQVLFWLLAATDGHAKNFSLFIDAGGGYRLTPFYDIISMYPVIGGKGLNIRDAKLAMGLKASKGKKYSIAQIFPRHFIQTAKAVGFDTDVMAAILIEIEARVDEVIDKVKAQLPEDFPSHIRESILDGLKDRSQRLKDFE